MNENVSRPSLYHSEKSENLERVKKSNYSSFAFLLWTTLWENKKRRDVKSVRIWIDCGWTKLVKSKDVSKVESTPLKISIVTHEPLWRPLWRVRDLIKLHCLAELAFLNLHCRLVDTIGEGLRGSTVDGHQTMPLFLRICIVPCSSCICSKVIRKKNEDSIRFRWRFFNSSLFRRS